MPKFEVEKFIPFEEPTQDGLGLVVHQKTLFHATASSINRDLSPKFVSGIYLSSQEEIAARYAAAKFSKNQEANSIILKTKIQNVRLLDLRTKENTRIILAGFKASLREKFENSKLSWAAETALQTTLQSLDLSKIKSGHLKEFLVGLGKDLAEYCESLGYDGLVTLEGGEGSALSRHDTYLIFNPKEVRVIEEKVLES